MDEDDRRRFDYEWEKLKAKHVGEGHLKETLREMARNRRGPPEHIVDEYVRAKLEKERQDQALARSLHLRIR